MISCLYGAREKIGVGSKFHKTYLLAESRSIFVKGLLVVPCWEQRGLLKAGEV